MREKLLISFSGGRTSAYMTWWLMNEWEERDKWDMKVVFANTGKEVSGTLLFVHRCSLKWKIPIVWVEAWPVTEKGWGVTHEVVDYFTASRSGQPFERMIEKLGIPCPAAPFCSDQLKRLPIESYLKSIGWKNYHKAIGIRSDEIDRMNENFRKLKIMYPLIRDNPVNKKMINEWWIRQEFNLEIDDDLGNCDGCWKKAMSKLTRIAKNHPNVFNWWQKMTDKYIDFKPRKGSKEATKHNFYRGNMSPHDICALSKLEQTQLQLFFEDEKLEGCNESCEAF